MKNLVRFAVAGAMLAGFATAQAQNLPSSNSSDLWLFVADTSTNTTFAEDLGSAASINSLLPASSLQAANTASPPTLVSGPAASLNIAASAQLATFLSNAAAAGNTLEWAVEGAQYNATAQKSTKTLAPGGLIDIFSQSPSQAVTVGQMQWGALQTSVTGFNGDMQYVTTGYTAGGIAIKQGQSGLNTQDVWGVGNGDIGGSTDLYGQGPSQADIALGQTVSLYAITGNGGSGQNQSYDLGDNLTLSANGTLTIGGTTTPPPPPVPLPAAVWLFGSGLLGLLGVGRRRAA
jgi:hypothetical protein